MEIINQLLQRAKPYFQELRRLNANCPKCKSQMVLKFASNPTKHYDRKLSIILCCSKNCDKSIWNTDANEKEFTHWWLDGKRNRKDYEKIINSLPKYETEFIKNLENCLKELNVVKL